MKRRRILILGHGNVQSRYVAPSCDFQNYMDGLPDDYEIVTFGYNDGVDLLIEPEDDFQRVVESLPDGWMPDFCLLWQAEWNLLPSGIDAAPFPVVAYISDWDYDIPSTRTIVQTADLTIVEADFDREALLSLGANSVEKFYVLGIMEEFIDPSPAPIKERPCDIFYSVSIGNTWYGDKSRFILDLCKLPEKYKILIRKPTGSYLDYISLLRNSKMVISHVRRGLMSIRTIEAGAQGTLSLNTGDEVATHFVPDREYIPVSHESFIPQIERYLENSDLLEEMSSSVYARVTDKYEARGRFANLVDFIDTKLDGDIKKRSIHNLKESEKTIRRGEIYYYTYFRSAAPGYRFARKEHKNMLLLAIDEFRRSVDAEATPRALTNLSVAEASYNFLHHGGEQERLNESISRLEQVVASSPSYVMASYNLGLLQFRGGNHTEALESFRRALTLLANEDSDPDPWSLQSYDFDLFHSLLQKPLNEKLLLLFSDREGAIQQIRNLYLATINYYIFLAFKGRGEIHRALEAVMEAFKLNPECGLIAREAAQTMALLGCKAECLPMYRKALDIMPLDMELRGEYIQILYLFRRESAAINEIKQALQIIKRTDMFTEESSAMKEMIAQLTRFDPSAPYSHDTIREKWLHKWVETLYGYLRKSPGNGGLVTRIVEIWSMLERRDKIFEIVEEYIAYCRGEGQLDGIDLSFIDNVCNYLEKSTHLNNEKNRERLRRLRSFMPGATEEISPSSNTVESERVVTGR